MLRIPSRTWLHRHRSEEASTNQAHACTSSSVPHEQAVSTVSFPRQDGAQGAWTKGVREACH